MLKYVHNSLAIEARWLMESGVVSRSAYQSLTHRGDMVVVRRGCRGRGALVDYESLPQRIKRDIEMRIGNPYRLEPGNALEDWLKPVTAAAEYFDGYVLPDGHRHLPADVSRQYWAEACILEAIGELLDECQARSKAQGRRRCDVGWPEVARLVERIDAVRWPHRLPTDSTVLRRKYTRYKKEGYESLIHGQWRNGQRNAAKVPTGDAEMMLLALASDPRNLDNAQVAMLYNAWAAQHGLDGISTNTVGRFRTKNAMEIEIRRRGPQKYTTERMMTVKRRAPQYPLHFWTLDGWVAELRYQAEDVRRLPDGREERRTTYTNRLTIEVVVDMCTGYPIGYAIGRRETDGLIVEALRQAVRHTAELFGGERGQMYAPWQLQMDRFGGKRCKEVYAQLGKYVTPAEVGNAKAKPIEAWFSRFNKRYCQLQPNWTGFGVTSKKDNQPNMNLLDRYKKQLPNEQEAMEQLRNLLELERGRLREAFVKAWNKQPEAERRPLSAEQYLLTFGETTGRTNMLQGTGIKLMIGGQLREFDCFDLNFRRHAEERWTVLYDPDTIGMERSLALAVNEDRSLRFVLEKKYEQPMALTERKEGDMEELLRIRRYNEDIKKVVNARLGAMAETIESLPLPAPHIEVHNEQARLEVLQKFLTTDSAGRHKDALNDVRLGDEGRPSAGGIDAWDAY